MNYLREAWLWLGEHEHVVIAIVVCAALVLTIAILAGADVTGFFRMVGGWLGLGS